MTGVIISLKQYFIFLTLSPVIPPVSERCVNVFFIVPPEWLPVPYIVIGRSQPGFTEYVTVTSLFVNEINYAADCLFWFQVSR